MELNIRSYSNQVKKQVHRHVYFDSDCQRKVRCDGRLRLLLLDRPINRQFEVLCGIRRRSP